MNKSDIITGIFFDEKDLLSAIKQIQSNDIKITDVRTPFPVHGLDDALKYKRSRLPKLGFYAGAVGAILAFGFQAWVFTSGWPINFGGKPFFSVPSFIPVTFELAVLFAAMALVFGFLIRSGIGPGSANPIIDERVTDDGFVIIIQESKIQDSIKISESLKASGATEIRSIPTIDTN
jgi:hypothetical protein